MFAKYVCMPDCDLDIMRAVMLILLIYQPCWSFDD